MTLQRGGRAVDQYAQAMFEGLLAEWIATVAQRHDEGGGHAAVEEPSERRQRCAGRVVGLTAPRLGLQHDAVDEVRERPS